MASPFSATCHHVFPTLKIVYVRVFVYLVCMCSGMVKKKENGKEDVCIKILFCIFICVAMRIAGKGERDGMTRTGGGGGLRKVR